MTVSTVRPTSDNRTNGTITRSSGAVNFSLLDDAPADDASFVTSSQTGASVWLGMGDLSLAADERVKQAKIRVRCFHNSADVGHQDQVDLRLRDPANNKATTAQTVGTYSNTAVEVASGWYTAAPGGFAWDQTRFNRVVVDIAWRCRSTGLTQLRASEVYLDADVRSQPVVSAVTVTGNTTSSRPSFSFTYTDDDFDPQIRWQAKAFSAAQFGATGFDPATSPATWDSGVISGSAVAGTVGIDLADTVQYRVYVRAAKAWVPAGTLWWSEWANSSTFTMTLTAPAAPVLAVTQESTAPGYRNRLVATITGINDLDANTSAFEDGTVGAWVAGANTNTPTASGTNPKSGSFGMLLTATAAGNIEALSGSFATSKRVKPGQVVSATASFRAATTGRSCQTGIRFFAVDGSTISTTMSSSTSDTTTGYTTVTLANQTAPANAYSYALRVLILSAGAGEQHRVDEAGLIRGAAATWSVGGYTAAGSVLFERRLPIAWDITQTPARNWLNPQLHSSGGLLRNTDGFYLRQANDALKTMPADRAYPGNPTDASAAMLEWTIRVGAFSYLDVGLPSGVASDGEDAYAFPAVAGVSMTYGVWAWCDSGTRTVKYAIVFVDELNNTINSSQSTGFTLTTTPQLCTFSATGSAGTVLARIETENTGGGAAVNWRYYQMGAHWRPTANSEVWPGQASGFEWETVRDGTVAFPADGDSAVACYDHEAPPDRPVIYRARIVASNVSGDAIASPNSEFTAVYQPVLIRSLVKDPFQPENAVVCGVNLAAGDQTASANDAVEHHPSGRDRDPVRITVWAGRTRQWTFVAVTQEEKYRLRQLLPSTRHLLVQWPEGGQTYLQVSSWQEEKFARSGWRFVVTANETRRPAA